MLLKFTLLNAFAKACLNTNFLKQNVIQGFSINKLILIPFFYSLILTWEFLLNFNTVYIKKTSCLSYVKAWMIFPPLTLVLIKDITSSCTPWSIILQSTAEIDGIQEVFMERFLNRSLKRSELFREETKYLAEV